MKKILVVILFLFHFGDVYSGELSNCPQFYYNSIKPKSVIVEDTVELCMDKFVIEFSKREKTPLWSAEYLSRNDVIESKTRVRTSRYYTEKRLPKHLQSKNSDYDKSGYDKGHLTPFKDQGMSSDINSLANIVPQAPRLNRIKWEQLESRIREDAIINGGIFIVTGVSFKETKKIGTGIPVPNLIYKVVFYPLMIKAFIAENRDDADVIEVPVSVLKQYTGIEF